MKVLDPKFVSRWAVAFIGSLVVHIIAAGLLFAGNTGRAPAPDPVDANASVTTEPNATPDPAATPETPDPAPRSATTEGTRSSRSTQRPPRANARNTPPAATSGTSPATDATEPKTKNYRVKKGDNLTHIARDCGSTPAELAKLNGVSEKQLANLKIGQVIKIKATEE